MWSLLGLLNRLIAALQATASALANNTLAVNLNTATGQQTNKLLAELLERLRNLPDPGPVSLTITAENQNVLTYKINLPSEPAEPNDIASGELTITVNGQTPAVVATTKGQTEVDGLSGEQGDTVEVTFAYIDDAGNRSVHPSVLNVTLADTIPPADPGALGLEVTAET